MTQSERLILLINYLKNENRRYASVEIPDEIADRSFAVDADIHQVLKSLCD